MPCKRLDWVAPDGSPTTVIVCTRGGRKRCHSCGANAPFLCDFPTGGGKTCDRPLCAKHARTTAPNAHLCHQHYMASLAETGPNP